MLTKFWVEFFAQIAGVTESPCSPGAPMYCPSRMLDVYFEAPTLGMLKLVNGGGDRQIDIQSKTIFNDQFWKGIYPPDSRVPTWVFQNGFNKKFSMEGGQLRGVTSTFDDRDKGREQAQRDRPRRPVERGPPGVRRAPVRALLRRPQVDERRRRRREGVHGKASPTVSFS